MASSVNKAILVELYVGRKMSIPDVAREIGTNYSAARKLLLDTGINLRSRTEGILAVRHKMGHLLGKKRQFTDEWKENMKISAIARGEATAVGTSIKPNGYAEITRGAEKGKSVHVSIMERRLGRPMLADECVHHIDGNKLNNDDNNLALLTRAGHMRLHRREQKISKEAKQ